MNMKNNIHFNSTRHDRKDMIEKQKIVAMAWMDNKKANAMVQQTLIIECLKMYKISILIQLDKIEKT